MIIDLIPSAVSVTAFSMSMALLLRKSSVTRKDWIHVSLYNWLAFMINAFVYHYGGTHSGSFTCLLSALHVGLISAATIALSQQWRPPMLSGGRDRSDSVHSAAVEKTVA